ncbi:uncharacterized protein B0H64DRAFT_221881 [Chaetomium fimeti]|uniref:Uncharacterized protein n=1 Tax=Chaetomium fimeti TaxID=1854472 RepID=A0AAE0H941_9PEZI|nr:hypothetical protein B0H64DRAFT_221881 [Chaetomium fimeti]
MPQHVVLSWFSTSLSFLSLSISPPRGHRVFCKSTSERPRRTWALFSTRLLITISRKVFGSPQPTASLPQRPLHKRASGGRHRTRFKPYNLCGDY